MGRRIFLKIIIFYLLFSGCSDLSFCQLSAKLWNKMGTDPIFFVDSVRTDFLDVKKLSPFEISNFGVIGPKKAKRVLGEQGKDGAIYVTTVHFARIHYWNLFCSKSKEYRELVPTPESDSIIKYILNNKLLSDVPYGDLFLVNNKVFKKLKVITREELSGRYHVQNKEFGVVIKTRKIKGLVKRQKG